MNREEGVNLLALLGSRADEGIDGIVFRPVVLSFSVEGVAESECAVLLLFTDLKWH